MVASFGYLRVRLASDDVFTVYRHRQQPLTESADGFDGKMCGRSQDYNEKNSQNRVNFG